MIDTRLVFFEGIPGSGKSTTAQRLYLHLLRQGHAARWYYEFDQTHPILTSDERKQIADQGIDDANGMREKFLARWRAFAQSQLEEPGATILDGALLQVPVGLLLLLNDEPRRIVRHLRDVGQSLAALKPQLVHLYQEDVAAAIAAICQQRKDASFDDALVELVANTPYGRSNQVRDLAGVVAFYQRKREIVDLILPQLEIPLLNIETSAGDWEEYERRITQFLSLPEIEPFAEVEDPDQYIGRYRSAGESEDLYVTVGPKGICLDGHDPKRLIHKHDKTFFLEACCLELIFEEDDLGAIQRFHLNGPVEIPESEWRKVT